MFNINFIRTALHLKKMNLGAARCKPLSVEYVKI